MTRKCLTLSALLFVVVATATGVNAGSGLQLYEGPGVDYIKHVNFNSGSGSTTSLLVQNIWQGDARIQIKVGARATDGSTLWQTRTIYLKSLETRTVTFSWSTNVTDLNFIQLVRLAAAPRPG